VSVIAARTFHRWLRLAERHGQIIWQLCRVSSSVAFLCSHSVTLIAELTITKFWHRCSISKTPFLSLLC